jgi:manganese/zinc/iron transport system substrate-binding protein
LMGPEIDPHSYEIVKGDSEKLSRAEIVFANGLSLEHSLSMKRALKAHPHVIYITDTVDPKEIIHVDESPDPHVWMDLSLWTRTTLAVERALIAKDSQHAEAYHERGKQTRAQFKEYDETIKELIQAIPQEKRRLVTSHDAFNYFARRYLEEEGNWKDRVKSIQGLAPEEQISSLEIKRVVEYIKNYEIPVIFAEQNLSRDSLIKVVDSCKRSGCSVVLAKEELYGDTLGKYDYLGMIKHNAIVIKTSLANPELALQAQE